jgi:hypothetical protein
MPDKMMKFKQFSNGSYAMDPNDDKRFELNKKPYQFISTMEDNMKFLSKRKHKRAKQARELYEAMGTPMVGDLKAMIQMNLSKTT